MSQAWKLGYEIDKTVCVQSLKLFNCLAGMLADVQVSWSDPTVHVQGFSCWKRETDDCDVILVVSKLSVYIKGREYIRGSTHELEVIVLAFGS